MVFTFKVAEGSLEIERLTDYTETLEGRLGDLDEKVQSLEERKETLEVCYFAMLPNVTLYDHPNMPE